jgi:hypothetical protein
MIISSFNFSSYEIKIRMIRIMAAKFSEGTSSHLRVPGNQPEVE